MVELIFITFLFCFLFNYLKSGSEKVDRYYEILLITQIHAWKIIFLLNLGYRKLDLAINYRNTEEGNLLEINNIIVNHILYQD